MAVYTTIDNPELYFQVKAYSGNGTAIGSGGQAITLDGSENMQPDMVYVKRRDHTNAGQIHDAVRGATKFLPMDGSTDAQETNSETLTAFNSDGFTVGSHNGVNNASGTYVAWCWKESATAGFDILTFEGNSTDDTDISHNLSAIPHWMVVCNFDAAKDRCVYHHKNTSAPETDLLVWNTNAATTDTNDRWSDEAPTSSVFTVGDSSQLNASGNTSIAYLWSEKQGFSKFGSYTGNGNDNGVYVHLGFRPSWFMCKRTDSANTWNIMDNKRDPHNEVTLHLSADDPHADETSTSDSDFDFCANGIKIREGNNGCNGSGATYIYIAFAEAPFVNSKGVPANAR